MLMLMLDDQRAMSLLQDEHPQIQNMLMYTATRVLTHGYHAVGTCDWALKFAGGSSMKKCVITGSMAISGIQINIIDNGQ